MENNILMAEFMGMYAENKNLILPLGNDEYYIDLLDEDTFKFDSDWNWLMSVVEKIQSNKLFKVTFGQFYDDEIQLLTGEYYCKIINYNNDIVDIMGCSSAINAVYKSCIEFIKWANQIKLNL
jgi:hypothetical protein|nr:MAG TPA: hypothetical protein [Caudoviricetes sp.]